MSACLREVLLTGSQVTEQEAKHLPASQRCSAGHAPFYEGSKDGGSLVVKLITSHVFTYLNILQMRLVFI